MKLDKPKIITLGIVLLLVICALSSIAPQIINASKENKFKQDIGANKEKLDKDYIISANKFNAFPEIFKTEKPVLVYGYINGGLDKAQSDIFHKNLTKLLAENNITQETVVVENWNKTKEKLTEKYIDGDDLTCAMVTEDIQNLEKYLDFAEDCFSNACIIDKKNNAYVTISRNEELIIKTLKGEVEIYDETKDN